MLQQEVEQKKRELFADEQELEERLKAIREKERIAAAKSKARRFDDDQRLRKKQVRLEARM